MVRKVAHIVITVILLVSTTGITVTRHYCGSNLRSSTLIGEPESCCDTPGCCHNEKEHFKIDENFALSAFLFDFDPIMETVPQLFETVSVDIPVRVKGDIFSDRPSPPLLRSLLVSHQTFLL